jgi:hypothetical protein
MVASPYRENAVTWQSLSGKKNSITLRAGGKNRPAFFQCGDKIAARHVEGGDESKETPVSSETKTVNARTRKSKRSDGVSHILWKPLRSF